jgi:hypothetical protein
MPLFGSLAIVGSGVHPARRRTQARRTRSIDSHPA